MLNEDTTIQIDSLGFSITIPEGWALQSDESVRLNRKEVTSEANERINQAQMPLVAARLVRGEASQVSPSIQASYGRLPHPRPESPLELLTSMTHAMASMFEQFTFVREPEMSELCSLPAAYSSVSYNITSRANVTFPVQAHTWIAFRGDEMFILGFSGPLFEDANLRQNFQLILDSLVIHPEAEGLA